jgi:hypothetical protein
VIMERTVTYDANVIYADVTKQIRPILASGTRQAQAQNLMKHDVI